jgi:hypothetical protein
MCRSTTLNQVTDIVFQWLGNIADLIEIDILDLAYPSYHYIMKRPSYIVNIYTGLKTYQGP